jgi:hypothetical protein
MNLWYFIVNGITSILTYVIYGTMPTHTELGLAQQFVTWTANGFGLTFVILLSNFNLLLPAMLFGFMLFVLEPARLIYRAGRAILSAVK